MKKIRMGIVGVGNMGSSHSKKLFDGEVPGMELSAVCDISKERREYCERNFPGVPVFATATEMFESGLIDAVEIATPHYDHPKFTMMALESA